MARAGDLDYDLWNEIVARAKNLDVLISAAGRPVAALDPARARRLLEFTLRLYTTICADTSGGLDGATLEILALARRIVLVCEPTLAGAWLAKEKARLLRSLDLEDRITVVLNRWSKDAQLSISDMEGLMGLAIDHRFPESPAEIRQTVLRASEISPSCEWGQALSALSEDLTGDGSSRQKAAPEAQDRVLLAGAGALRVSDCKDRGRDSMSILMRLLGSGSQERQEVLQQCRDCLGEFEDAQRYAEGICALYQAALDSVSARLVLLPQESAAGHLARLRELRRRVGPLLPKREVEGIRKEFDDILKSMSDDLRSTFDLRERQIHEGAAALAVLSEVVAAHDKPYRVRFEALTKSSERRPSRPTWPRFTASSRARSGKWSSTRETGARHAPGYGTSRRVGPGAPARRLHSRYCNLTVTVCDQSSFLLSRRRAPSPPTQP